MGGGWTGRLGGGLLLVALTAPAVAQEPTPAPPAPTGPPLQGELSLTLQEALALGLENNLDVEIERYEPLISEQRHVAAWGIYDPEIFAEYDYSSFETPVASALQTQQLLLEREISGVAGLRGLVPKLGWSYQLGYAGQSLETNSSIQQLSPEYRTSLLATATAPLLRGFLWGEPWVQVKLAGLASETALQQFLVELMDTVESIENAYWDLAARQEDLRVAQASLETAQELLEQTRAQYEVGVVSRVEVVEAEAGVADRDVNLIRTDNFSETSQDLLIDLILGAALEPATDLAIVPADPPTDYRIFEVDRDVAAERAFAHRPELVVARQFEAQQALELKFAKNQRLPQIDLRGRWGLEGLAGQTNPAPPIFGGARAPVAVPRSYWAADDTFFDGEQANQWSAGAVFSIPLGNVTGRANVVAEQLELRRAHAQTRRLEQDIVVQLRRAIRNLESGIQGIEAAESRRRAAAEQLRAERIRLEYGESTPFEVLQREEDLVEAESQKINALQIYHNSVTALDRAQGTILRDRNIVVDDALTLR